MGRTQDGLASSGDLVKGIFILSPFTPVIPPARYLRLAE